MAGIKKSLVLCMEAERNVTAKCEVADDQKINDDQKNYAVPVWRQFILPDETLV